MKRLNNNSGFGLIETLIAIVLLSIVMAAGMSLYTDSDELMGLAMRKKVAEQIANAKLEEIRIDVANSSTGATYYANLSSSTSSVNVGGLTGTQTVTVSTEVMYKDIAHTVVFNYLPDPVPPCKRVVVTITWTEPRKLEAVQQIELTTLIARP